MAAVAFGIFDHVDRGDEPLGTLFEQRLKLVEAADAAGFRTYHVAEHHATPLGMAPVPGVYLAAVAQRTRRLRFGPLVYLLPLYTPLRLIEEICMLDHLSGGRFELGVGRGISPYELAYSGVDFLAAQEIYEESLEIILAGLRGGRLTHHGRHYTYRGVPMELEPVQKPHPPLWQGVVRPDGAADAARRGVNIVSTLGSTALKPLVERYLGAPAPRPRWWERSAPSSWPTPTPKRSSSPGRPTSGGTRASRTCGASSTPSRSALRRRSTAPSSSTRPSSGRPPPCGPRSSAISPPAAATTSSAGFSTATPHSMRRFARSSSSAARSYPG
jgi:Luciferase-like monooxygenase